ncbi:MAG: helix-turn-helix transcriptional regulator [Gammaproteobacteria bacterium]|nr:helix-turn-helix transcriptional regulator [Gammaproteobacteria bacterium]
MKPVTPAVSRATARIGSALRTARLRRRLSQKDMAMKMGVSLGTVQRMERGDPGVAIGNIAMAFLCINCLQKLENVLNSSLDEIGAAMDAVYLPNRARSTIHKNQTANSKESSSGSISF